MKSEIEEANQAKKELEKNLRELNLTLDLKNKQISQQVENIAKLEAII